MSETRAELEERAWQATPCDERRAVVQTYHWRTKRDVSRRLAGNDREIVVFDPSGDTPGRMNPWVPLWSLYSDELRQAADQGAQPVLRPPYLRSRRDTTGDVESSGVSASSDPPARGDIEQDVARIRSGSTRPSSR